MKIHFRSSLAEQAQQAFREMTRRYGQTEKVEDADVIASLGGDGETLGALQDSIRFKKPVFGLNFGSVGFLQNVHKEDMDLIQRIDAAEVIELSPLKVEAEFIGGDIRTAFAVNEIHVCNNDRGRQIYMRAEADGKLYVDRLGADGLIIATTLGSTAYNRSAGGLVLQLSDNEIALTPNNRNTPECLRPAAVFPRPVVVEVFDPHFRIADLRADAAFVGSGCMKAVISLDSSNRYKLLCDPGYSARQKILRTKLSASNMCRC